MKTRITVFVLVIVYIFCTAAPAVHAEVPANKLFGLAKGIILYEKHVNGIPDTDSVLSGKVLENASFDCSDWLAIGASRFGFDEDYEAYYQAWQKGFLEYISEDREYFKATEYHRAILTALALGKDPTNISGNNLVAQGVYDFDFLSREGINGDIWAIIAADSYDWQIPADAKNTRYSMMGEISVEQQKEGSFALTPTMPPDPDMTAMVLTAFAPYKEHEVVSHSIGRAVNYLESAFANGECTTCETLAQMICAYCALGEDYTSRDIYDDMTEEFLSYQREDGGFAHLKEDKESSEMASCQALLALSAMVRQERGCRDLYDFQPEPKNKDRSFKPEYSGNNTSGKGYIFTLESMSEYIPDEDGFASENKIALVVLMLLVPCAIGAVVGIMILGKSTKKETEDTEES